MSQPEDERSRRNLNRGRTLPAPTNGRPMPGTRVTIRRKIRGHTNRHGWVWDYEWDWNSHVFPVYVEHIGARLMTIDEIEIVADQRSRNENRDKRPHPTTMEELTSSHGIHT